MRFHKILKNSAIALLIICIIILAIDVFKVLKINFDFLGMQSSERISYSNDVDALRYEPTSYVILNKSDALDEIKKIVINLKSGQTKSDTNNLFEIANIHKIETFFYEYQKYAVTKYKLLNIIEDLPKLCKKVSNYNNEQLSSYFSQNSSYIEEIYGITDKNEFIELAKSLSFLDNGKIDVAILQNATINFSYEDDFLTFNIKMKSENKKDFIYFVKVEYYKSNDNQVSPYVTFKVNN